MMLKGLFTVLFGYLGNFILKILVPTHEPVNMLTGSLIGIGTLGWLALLIYPIVALIGSTGDLVTNVLMLFVALIIAAIITFIVIRTRKKPIESNSNKPKDEST